MNPREPPDLDGERGLANHQGGPNPARVLLYIVGGICVFRGLSLIFLAFFELTLLAFGGIAIWLARQRFDSTVRLATVGWSVSAILFVIGVIAMDPPSSKRDVTGVGVAGLALLIAVAVATIAFRRQPMDNTEQPPTSSAHSHSLADISDANNIPMQLAWWIFARWSLSLSLIRHPSKLLMISLGVVGVAQYVLLPAMMYAVVISSSGGWNVK